MKLILGIMKVLMNGILAILGLMFLNIQLALFILPFILVLFLLVWFMDAIFNMIAFIVFCFTLIGLFLSWSFVNKDKADFYTIVAYTIFFGGALLTVFESSFEPGQDFYGNIDSSNDSNIYLSILFPLAISGLINGYILFKFGLLTFLQGIYKIYNFIKYRKVPIKWLVIYYYCKYKKLKVFDDYEYRKQKSQPTIITINKDGKFKVNSLFKNEGNEENELLSLNNIKAQISARLKVYPAMEVIVACESYVSISVVSKLVTSLLKNDVKEIRLRMNEY